VVPELSRLAVAATVGVCVGLSALNAEAEFILELTPVASATTVTTLSQPIASNVVPGSSTLPHLPAGASLEPIAAFDVHAFAHGLNLLGSRPYSMAIVSRIVPPADAPANFALDPFTVPEPYLLAFFGTGLLVLGVAAARRRRAVNVLH
jgi:hypothetical protein